MSMVFSDKQKELRPNAAFYVMSFICLTALCNLILFYSYPTINDMSIMVPFLGIAAFFLVVHIIAYIIKNKQFVSHMNQVVESLPLTKEQKNYLAKELHSKSKSINSQDDISKKIHELATKVKKDDQLSEREIEVINKIVFGHYAVRPTIENNLKQ